MHEHFKEFLSVIRAQNLSGPQGGAKDRVVVLAESEDATNQIIDREIGSILSNHSESLIDLHITDHQVYNK